MIGRLDRIFVAKGTQASPAEDPKAVIRRWVEAWNAQDLDAAEELLAPEFVRHDANLPDVVGPRADDSTSPTIWPPSQTSTSRSSS
jgi:ketosteroid isomerase-like protein